MGEEKAFVESKKLEYSSVQKAIQLLLSFVPDNQAAGNLQLSRNLGLNKSTVSRLMQVLLYYGLLQQDPASKKYELGPTAAALGIAVESSQKYRLAELSRPYLEQLRDRIGESVCLEVIDSGKAKVLAEAAGPPPLSASFRQYLPLHVAAGAKAILAYDENDYVDILLPDQFEPFTENSIVDKKVFLEQLKEIKQSGVAYDFGEVNVDVHTMASAVFNHKKKAVGAICVCVPSLRLAKLEDAECISQLKRSAAAVSARLFFNATKFENC